MFPEIIVTSNIRGVVYIGASFLGETDKTSFQSFIATNDFYLLFLPIATNIVYAPMTIPITISNSIPVCDSKYTRLIKLSECAYLLEVNPPILSAHTIPRCLSFLKIENRFIASIIKQNTCYLVIEDNEKQLGDGFFPLLINDSPFMNIMYINDTTLLIVYDNTKNIHILIKKEDGFILSHSFVGQSFSAEQNRITITNRTNYGHSIENTYTVANNTLTLLSTVYSISDDVHDNITEDFIECVMLGISEKALSYLADDLPLTFDELKEFLGDFTEYKQSPINKSYLLIQQHKNGTYSARRFAFDVQNRQISNIEEL